jgi:hypothetical protein
MAWDVYVMDANGCSLLCKPLFLTQDYYFGRSNAVIQVNRTYTITVTATEFSTALHFSADGSNYQTGNVITVNAQVLIPFRLKMLMDVVLLLRHQLPL